MYFPHLALASVGLALGVNLATSHECILLERLSLCIPGEECRDEDAFECQGADGTVIPIVLEETELEQMKTLVAQHSVVSGVSILTYADQDFDDDGIHISPGDMSIDNSSDSDGRRKLNHYLYHGPVTGDSYYLVVRVIDKNGLAYPHNTETMSDNMFGTGTDQVNMKSQIADCSADQLNLIPGLPPAASPAQVTAVDALTTGVGHPAGFMEATIDIDITSSADAGSRYWVRNSVITEVQNLLGFNLPGPFDHVVFNLEGCYHDCGWAAYAYIYSWNQVYQGYHYYMSGVQVHEYGHNLGLAHSGIQGGGQYTDHTCSMGNPLYSDEIGKMCFNPAKSYQLNWYDREVVDVTVAQWQGDVMGVGEWKDFPGAYTAIIKIETGTGADFFVGFNRAAGANAQNVQQDDKVTVTRVDSDNGLEYSLSWRQFAGAAGSVWTSPNHQGTGQDLTVTVNSIDISVTPGIANICISLGPCVVTTSPPTAAPTDAPTDAPTAAPTDAPNPGANSDPIILGLQGQVFKFEGRDGGWYSNVSNKYLQWNMQFRQFGTCPAGEDMFVSGLSIDDKDSNILIATTPEATEECRSDPNAVCLGEGTLHLSFDGGKTFVSKPGDYHFNSRNRVVAHNTYAACSRKWHDYEVSTNERRLRNTRDGGRRATVEEKKPLQLLKDVKTSMIDSVDCESWIENRVLNDDLFEQRGHWSTLYVETTHVSFHIEYRRSDWFDPKCEFQSLDAWMTKVSNEMEQTEWYGILGETKHKIYDKETGEQITADRHQLLSGKDDSDYEVSGPLNTEFAAASKQGFVSSMINKIVASS